MSWLLLFAITLGASSLVSTAVGGVMIGMAIDALRTTSHASDMEFLTLMPAGVAVVVSGLLGLSASLGTIWSEVTQWLR